MTQQEINAFLRAFTTRQGEQYELPVIGSLGLLALGDIGLIAWRLKQKEAERNEN